MFLNYLYYSTKFAFSAETTTKTNMVAASSTTPVENDDTSLATPPTTSPLVKRGEWTSHNCLHMHLYVETNIRLELFKIYF